MSGGKQSRTMACQKCGAEAARKAGNQKYCPACSEAESLKRKVRWTKASPRKPASLESYQGRRHAAINEVGRRTSQLHAESVMADLVSPLDRKWMVRVAIPFEGAASKNFIFGISENGHVYRRQQALRYRTALTLAMKAALRDVRVYENKLWVEIFVQKPSHKSDAVNVVDLVCDALKDAAGVDDRWFAIARLDWQIVKTDPELIVGISQADCFDAQPCSKCGRILPRDKFGSHAGNKKGISRTCNDCTRLTVVDKDGNETKLSMNEHFPEIKEAA